MAAGEAQDGWPAEKLFDGATNGYTYDDIVFMPGHINSDASDVELSCQLTRNILLRTPIIAGPADTVTEANLASQVALVGGIGIIHRNQSIESQAEMVKRVKRHDNGFILEPSTLSPNHCVADVDRIKSELGFSGIMITADGKLGSKMVGVVTNRDTDPVEDRSALLETVMSRDLKVGCDTLSLPEAHKEMMRLKVGKLPIVDSDGRLVSLVSRRDMKKSQDFPSASRDPQGRLLVGAAVTTVGQEDFARAEALIGAGADILFVDVSDSADGHDASLVQRIKQHYPMIDIIAGQVSKCRAAKYLLDAGADGIWVGYSSSWSLGPGFQAAVVGRPEATALFEVSKYVHLNYHVPVVASGDMRNAGHILKALCLGATAVVVDDAFSGTEEAPGRLLVQSDYSCAKLHHGPDPVPSTPLVNNHAGRFAKVPNMSAVNAGVAITEKGPIAALVNYLVRGVRSGMRDLGLRTISELHVALKNGTLRMEVRSPYGVFLQETSARAARHAMHPEVTPAFVAAPRARR